MRAKKAAKPSRSIRYLLSADRRLQKLSLRKISDRLNQAKQRPRSTQPKSSAGAKPAASRWETSWPAIVTGIVCLVAGAALIGLPAPPEDVALAGAQLGANAALESAPVAKTVISKAPATAARSTTRAAGASVPKPPRIEPVKPPPPAETSPNDAVDLAAVTVTGCLEANGETFWLKDSSGAPKSRSWRSGFLKKRPSRIELVDDSGRLRLSNHVGRRIAATGILLNREMRARSLRVVTASCN